MSTSRTEVGQTFSSHNLAASSDSWRQSFTFLPSVQIYVIPCTRKQTWNAQITVCSTYCRNGEAGEGSNVSLRPLGFSWQDKARCFFPTDLSFQSQNTVHIWPWKVRCQVACTQHALPVVCREALFFGSLNWTPSSTHAFWSFFELSSQLHISIVTRLKSLINSPHGLLPPRPQFSPPNQEWCHHHGIPTKKKGSPVMSGVWTPLFYNASSVRGRHQVGDPSSDVTTQPREHVPHPSFTHLSNLFRF